MHGPDDEPGVSLSEAHLCYCRPDITERFNEAGARAGWSVRHVRSRLNGLSPRETARSTAVANYKAAEKSAVSDLVAKLRDGRLIARGFVIGPGGRNPDADRSIIPEDILQARKCRITWREETISGNGLTFAGVRLYSPYEAPESAASLIGRSLAECFRLVVVDDWVRQELEEPIFKRFAGWRFRPNSYSFFRADHWPVRFEDWSDAAYMVRRFKFPIMVLGVRDPDPPEDVVLVRNRIEAQVRRLITWLRDDTLLADGIKEPKDHALTRKVLPRDWWRQPDVEMDTAKSSLWKLTTSERVCTFSDIRIVAPAATVQETADAQPQQDPPRTKGNPGRKASWDWDAATRELVRLANSPDGLPNPQAAIESHFANWFLEEFGDHPSESAIRKFVRNRLPPGYHEKN